MNVLITGSSGQIGTNLALALRDRGDCVEGIDCRNNTWTDRIPTHVMNLTAVQADDLPASVKYDAVVHLAAHAKVFELVENPTRAMENIQMAFVVLEYCRRRGIPIVFGSSREVYGDIHRHVTEEDQADFVVAESPYSASKIAAEAMIYSYGRCYGLPFMVFRFSNVYGRYDSDIERMERVIPLFARRIAEGRPLVVYGREKVLDFTFVDDCTEGIIRGIDALLSERVQNETINLACGQGNTLVDVVNILALVLGRTPNVRYEPSRSGEVTRYVADISKARELLGYCPQTPLSAGLPREVAWQRQIGSIE
jgi:nucleoside-diphosphate-sugar epimerase